MSNSVFAPLLSDQRKVGLILAILGTTLFSFKSVVIKLAYQYEVTAEQVIALRMIMSGPFYLVLLFWLQHSKPIKLDTLRRNGMLLSASGALGYYLASLLDLKGLELISAQLERLILFTYPGFVMLFSWLVWRRLPGTKTVLAMLLTYLGIVVVLGVEVQNNVDRVLLGGALVLTSAAMFAGYLILSKRGIRELGSQQFTCLAMLVACGCVALHYGLLHQSSLLGLPIMAYAYVLILAVFCTVIPSLLIAAAIARLGPQQTSVLGGLGPIITAVMAVFILNEPFGWQHFTGTFLVGVGVILIASDKGEA